MRFARLIGFTWLIAANCRLTFNEDENGDAGEDEDENCHPDGSSLPTAILFSYTLRMSSITFNL